MEAAATVRWVPRHGSRIDEFEDACAPTADGKWQGKRLRAAVADGATESLLSGPWARQLVEAWVEDPRRPPSAVIPAARAAWCTHLDGYLAARSASDRPVQWYEEPGLARGAHATFLGVQFSSPRVVASVGKWTAVARGDTCVFQVRGHKVVDAFPRARAADFGPATELVGSVTDDPGRLPARFGQWLTGDTFILATDAFARWFLAEMEGGASAAALADVACANTSDFAAWVDARRGDGTLRNDDVMVMSVACL